MQIRRGPVRWKITRQAMIRLAGSSLDNACQIQDLSFKGAQITLPAKLPEDTFLELVITLSEGLSFEVEAWVVWHKVIDGYNAYGLYFTKMKDADKEKLFKFVYQHYPQEVKEKWFTDLVGEKGGEKMEDRRIFQRFIVSLPVKFLDLSAGKEGVAQACDISAKGIGLISNEELKPRSALEIWLQILGNGKPLYTRGVVVWSKQEAPNKYRLGINLEKADLIGLSRALRTV